MISIDAIDLGWLDIPQAIAASLVRGPAGAVLIETGPGSTIDALERGLRERGIEPGDLAAAIVSHIHLDHAGAAWWVAEHGAPDFCKIDVEGYEAEILDGLSTTLPMVSIEYLPSAIDVAVRAVGRLADLGDYRFNVSVGESMVLLWPQWETAEHVVRWLSDRDQEEDSGDIYARVHP